MNRLQSTLLTLIYFPVLLLAQPSLQPTSDSLVKRLNQQYLRDRAMAEQISRERNIPLRMKDKNGRISAFAGFDMLGDMLFDITDNVGAGRTISTNKVWPGGIVGTSLTGNLTGNRLGAWDGGATRVTHQELVGRVVQVDGSTQVDDHATHVAGTMIGSGVSANAKGMSYQATLRVYDWDNDGSEMSAAAANGMLLSNHSYGVKTGWYFDGTNDYWIGNPSISNTEDYKFGFYDQRSAEWDNIVATNPYYLIVKSAGNDRGDNKTQTNWFYANGSPGVGTPPPADGQYDCISTYSGAKNILTVGAVNKIGNSNTNNGYTQASDVVMSSFSGWGPMDDGRIKPDVVGCGVGVYSSTAVSNTSYNTYQGTSMSSPNVCGSLLLVQQHYFNLKNVFMRASTLKGLAIHTADEAGNSGPDYKFGWGLVNIAKAVQVITDSVSNQIQEKSLTNTKTYSQNISSSGVSPLRVTICWTDPAGTPVNPSLDPGNRMLVNDLDIRLTRLSDNTVFFPYILDKANPAAVATTGNNIVDNVEQIYLAAPQAGTYSVVVSHKGTLVGTQNFSLIVSGLMGFPVAGFSASTRSVCTGSQVTFTDNSSGSPTNRTWYFPGGFPTTSTAAAPVVTYSNAGKFPVSLVVSNALGKDSVYSVNYITAGGITLPFSETFETNSASRSSWTIDNPNNDTTWRLATIKGTSPGNQAYCMPFFNYTNIGRRDGLITPAISLKGYSSANLTFMHAYAKDPTSASDSLVIWVSTNCGTAWTRLLSKGENGTGNLSTVPDNSNEFIPDSAQKWCTGANLNCITLNLNAYVGLNNVKLKFEGYNRYSNNLFIDNVEINGTALLPVANFYASKTTACVGESISFYDSTINIGTAWQWTFNGAGTTSSSVQNPSGIVYNSPGMYTVKLKVTNSTGSDSITKVNYITVLANPNKPTISTDKNPSICTGDSVMLTCDSPAIAYQWRLAGSKIPGAISNLFKADATGVYSVEITDAGGCMAQSDPKNVVVNTYPLKPTITSDLTSSFMCTGGTATLTSSLSSGNQWYRNDNVLNGSTSVSFLVTDSGKYSVRGINGDCVGTMSDYKIINLLPSPTTSPISGPENSIKNAIENYNVGFAVGSTYNWTLTGGIKISGGNTNLIQVQWTAAGLGLVKVQETSGNGCKGQNVQKSVTVANNTSLNEELNENAITIFPNPVSELLNLKFQSVNNENIEIGIMNVLGQVVFRQSYHSVKGWNEKTIATDSFSDGVYFLELKTAHGKISRRLIIQK